MLLIRLLKKPPILIKMETKRIIKSYENLTPELKELMKEKYPYGYANKLIRLTNARNETFFAVPLETEGSNYMVKVPLEKPKKKTEDDNLFSNDEEGKDNEDARGDDDDEHLEKGTDPSYSPNYDDVT